MARKSNTSNNKKKMIDALGETRGIVSYACQKVGIARKTFYEWYKNDTQFKSEVDDISEAAIDHVESKLFNKIDEGDTTSIIFYLKTKGKHRGYIDKQEHDVNVKDYQVIRPKNED